MSPTLRSSRAPAAVDGDDGGPVGRALKSASRMFLPTSGEFSEITASQAAGRGTLQGETS